MKERPILFSGEMVRAILDGRKSQTRRVIKPQPFICSDGVLRFPWASFYPNGQVHTWDRNGVGGQNWNANEYPRENKYTEALKRTPHEKPCPYGQPGDRLWVRENFMPFRVIQGCVNEYELKYQADGSTKLFDGIPPDKHGIPIKSKWKPSIHMPRWASRIMLEIDEIRVERLQDIAEVDAKEEGVKDPYDYQAPEYYDQPHMRELEINQSAFAGLWDAINSKRGYGWAANPLVWVIKFHRIEA